MKVTIDRIEGGYVVVELPDLSTVAVLSALFLDAHEGDVYSISKDYDEMSERVERIDALRNALFED